MIECECPQSLSFPLHGSALQCPESLRFFDAGRDDVIGWAKSARVSPKNDRRSIVPDCLNLLVSDLETRSLTVLLSRVIVAFGGRDR